MYSKLLFVLPFTCPTIFLIFSLSAPVIRRGTKPPKAFRFAALMKSA